MPLGRNAPNDWPAVPVKVMSMVSSGSPSPPQRLVSSEPSMVPTVRFTLRTGSSSRTRSPEDRAPSASWMRVLSSAFSRPWSCVVVWCLAARGGSSGTWKIGDRSRPAAFQWSTALRLSSSSACPTASSNDRKPSRANSSLTSCAMNWKKFTTCSA